MKNLLNNATKLNELDNKITEIFSLLKTILSKKNLKVRCFFLLTEREMEISNKRSYDLYTIIYTNIVFDCSGSLILGN